MTNERRKRNRTARRSNARTRYVRRIDNDRYPFVPYGLLPALGLLALLIFGLFPFARGIERNALQATQSALADINAAWARPTASGQWVTLEGRPPSKAEAAMAFEAARLARADAPLGKTRPVTRIRENFLWPNASGSPEANPLDSSEASSDWNIQLKNGVLKLSGEVPDDETYQAILEAANEAIEFPQVETIEDYLFVTGDQASEGYQETALRGLNTVTRCTAGTASFINNEFSLRCDVPQADAANIEELAQAPLPLGRLGSIDILTDESVTACEQSFATILADARIEFGTASAVIDSSNEALLDQIARTASSCPGLLRIEGHTDNTGRATYNDALSHRRAEAVRRALITRGLPASRLIAKGYGSAKPVASNDTEAGKASNRRIEFRVTRASD